MNQSLVVKGSVKDMAERNNMGVAESFLNADYIAVVDVSGSMGDCDARGGVSRYDAACSELTKLQAAHEGKVAVVAFSDYPLFCPGGVPQFQGSSTDLAGALSFVHVADGTVEYFVISDGLPDDTSAALAAARQFTSKINAIYIGPEGGEGERFLRLLAQQNGGKSATAAKAFELADTVSKLMLSEGKKK